MRKVIAYQMVLYMAPIVALLAGGIVWMNQQHRLTLLKNERETTQKEINTVQAQLKQAGSQLASKRYPTDEANPQEQSKFLDLLRRCALESSVEITNWKNTVAGGDAAPTPNGAGLPSSTPKPSGEARKLPEGISMVTSNVEVRGQFTKVRDFLYRLQLNPRLLSVHRARWTRDAKYPNTVAEFTLSRYVHQPSANPEIPEDVTTAVHHEDEHEHHHEEVKQ